MDTKGKKTVQIGNSTIGESKTFLVADVGSNHNQDLQIAMETIDAAAESGADAVKFQSLQMKELYWNPNENIKSLYRKINLEESWHLKLKNYCEQRNIIFFSSPTYMKAVDLLESINVQLYKLASAQIGTYPQIVERVAKTGKPVILSTGLVNVGELESSIRKFENVHNKNYIILHCNSIYPAPYERVNLPIIKTYRSLFDCPVGYSDHTQGIHIALAAVAAGASVIEKHFALNLSLDTPDIIVALNPKNFSRLHAAIRDVEKAMKPHKRLTIEPEEKAFKESLRYRLVLAKSKQKGENFNKDDFVFLRHTEGVDCRDLEMVTSYFCAGQSLDIGSLLNWHDISGKAI